MKKFLNLFILMFVTLLLVSCSKEKSILLSTTTSTENSGLLDYLLPYFEEETNIDVKVVAKGTGAALEMGKMGEADILLVHDKVREEAFINDGYGSKRSDVMYNDFVLVGPKNSSIDSTSLQDILNHIKINNLYFVSRGDDSGTHSKELSLWTKFSIENNWTNYLESGQGMGETLVMANEKEGYTLTDRATFLSMEDQLDLKIVFENDESLFNQYGVILVNPEIHKNIKSEEAKILYDWLLSERGQSLINEFGKVEYGQSLFFANAPKE